METTVQPKSQIRYDYIDLMKAIGIISVVYAHVQIYGGAPSNLLVKIIYMFHMPLFFFITGFLSKIRKDTKLFFIEKANQLLIPYFVYLFLVYLIQYGFYYYQNPFSIKHFASISLKFLLGGRWLSGYTGVFWFVPCLFISQQFINYLLVNCKIKLTIVITLICLAFSYLNAIYFQDIKFPYNINVVLAACPFYLSGFMLKDRNLDVRLAVQSFLFSMIGVFLIYNGFLNYYDMKNAVYGLPLITFISSLSAIVFLFYVVKHLTNKKLINKIGEASLVIMYLHQIVQISLNDFMTDNKVIRLIFGIIFPFIMFVLFKQWIISRALLLGSKEDLKKIMLVIRKSG